MWSARQQSMLSAMGYTLYVRPSLHAPELQADAASTATTANAPSDSALLKAVSKVVKDRDISRLGIDFDALRGSPHAKRALWAQLRRVIKS